MHGAFVGKAAATLTSDLHGTFGWPEMAALVDHVYRSLPQRDRDQASVLTGTYAQAAAVNRFRREAPRAVSGSMTYYLWGPEPGRGDPLIAFGVPRELLEHHYRRCTEQARIDTPFARPWDTRLPVFVCRDAHQELTWFWPELRNYGLERGVLASSP